jgi:hypothetical protein
MPPAGTGARASRPHRRMKKAGETPTLPCLTASSPSTTPPPKKKSATSSTGHPNAPPHHRPTTFQGAWASRPLLKRKNVGETPTLLVRNFSSASSPSTTPAPNKKSAASSTASAPNTKHPPPPPSPSKKKSTSTTTLPLQNPQSPISNLPSLAPDPTALAALAAHFGKRTKARIQQIAEILKTLEGLGKL